MLALDETATVEAIEPADSASGHEIIAQRREPSEPIATFGQEEKSNELKGSETLSEEEISSRSSEETAAESIAKSLSASDPDEEHLAGAEPSPQEPPTTYDAPLTALKADTSLEDIAGAAKPAPLEAFRTTRGLTARPAPVDTSVNLIKGQVLTPAGEPLIGASILLPNTSQGTVTDLQGHFTIAVPAGQQSFTVSYAGYQSESIPINRQDSFRVMLEETAPLTEVVVTDPTRTDRGGRSIAKMNEQALAAPRMSFPPNKAIPREGFPELGKYIRDNQQYPEEARREGIEGIVLLQFAVQADGSLEEFKVLQSLGHGCDEEAIRLLDKGPEWEVQNGEAPVMTTYPVRFELK